MQFWGELKDRKLVQWALAYVAFGIAFLEIVNAIETPFGLSNGLVRVIMVIVAAGFGVTLILAWFHGERGHQRVSALEMLLLLMVAGMGAAGATLAGRPQKNDRSALPPAASGWKAPVAAAERNSIAVLPFKNLSGDQKDDYFSDGITEELTNALGELPGLRVVSRTSASQFKSQSGDVREVGRSLGVSAVLEGSIQHAGSKVRIIARLVDASTGYQLWSDRIEADASDIFAAEDKISRSVAGALQVKLALGTQPTENARAADPAAHQSYLKGRYLASQNDPAATNQAEQHFREAMKRDPGYAPPYAGLAETYLNKGHWGMMPEEVARDSARMVAMKAWRMDSTMPQLHMIFSRISRDPHVRLRELQRAVELNPNLPEAKLELAAAQAALGDSRAAMKEAREAARLDPYGARSRAGFRDVMVLAGHPDQADGVPAPPTPPGVPGAVVVQGPHAPDVGAILADVCASLASNPWSAARGQAAAQCDDARKKATNPFALGKVALGYARLGRKAEALEVLAEYEKGSQGDPRQALTRAGVYAALGDMDQAFAALNGVEPHRLAAFLREPALAPLRRDARFSELQRRAES